MTDFTARRLSRHLRSDALSRLTPALLLVLVSSPVFAQPPSMPKRAPSNGAEQSEPGQASPDAQEAFHTTLIAVKQSLDALQALDPAFVAVQEALTRYRNKRSDEHRAEYAEAQTLALQLACDRLRAFLGHRKRFQDAYLAYKQMADESLQSLEKERSQLVESQTKLEETAAQFESLLDSGSTKHENELREGKPLPDEVEDLAEELELKIRLAQRKSQLHALFLSQTTTEITRWKEALTMATQVWRKVNLNFIAAAGDIEYLELIAGLRRRELDSRSPTIPIYRLADYDLGGFSATLIEVIDDPLSARKIEATQDASPMPERPRGNAVLIRRMPGATALQREPERASNGFPAEAPGLQSPPRTQFPLTPAIPPGIDTPKVEIPLKSEVPPAPLRRTQ